MSNKSPYRHIGWKPTISHLIRDEISLFYTTNQSIRYPTIVALKNGLFDLSAKKLREFSPKFIFRSKTSVAFNKNATTCPVIDGWSVDEWIRGLANNDPEVEHLLWQVIAALFRPHHAFGKAILLYSDGPNGKSTFLELLRQLVGVEQTATLSFSDFEGRHLPENLNRIFAVLSDDTNPDDFSRLPKAEKFKKWVAHKEIQANIKYGTVQEIQGRGLCVFCTNELPLTHKRSQLFDDHFIVIPFLSPYIETGDRRLVKEDYIKRPEVLEYVAHKALMMPLFNEFIEPTACKRIIYGQSF